MPFWFTMFFMWIGPQVYKYNRAATSTPFSIRSCIEIFRQCLLQNLRFVKIGGFLVQNFSRYLSSRAKFQRNNRKKTSMYDWMGIDVIYNSSLYRANCGLSGAQISTCEWKWSENWNMECMCLHKWDRTVWKEIWRNFGLCHNGKWQPLFKNV